ncbi:CehA/McbA family metallohydrolase [Marinitoga sp. 1135]|uniref:CehA/McbA family metallohydrolase n=1 Tax=Marinitoga sp. 1135 TaxID=1643333 RepID=UPI001586F13A|nr:CehA/McbA family metallohydrolase [Marinitoga sp. 1135]
MKKLFLFIFILMIVSLFSFPQKYILLFGNPHSHTAFSDGAVNTTPADAYKYARDIAKLDFHAVTDHAYYFEALYNGEDKFLVMKRMAEENTTKNFIALAGFEWTAGSGHINVYGSKEWTSRNIDTTIEEFYKWLINEKALAQFNHPISMFGTFKNFEYYPEADNYLNLVEVGNGNWSKNDTITPEMFSNYIVALKKGWHLGATIGQDNHKANWGTANDSRTGVWVLSRSKDGLLKAMWNRKTYGTEDKNAKIWVETDNAEMGDIYYYDKMPGEISLKIEYEDENSLSELKVYTPDKIYELSPNGNKINEVVKIKVTSPYFWLFVYFKQMDGDEIVSSPIWYEPENRIRIFNVPDIKLYRNSENTLNLYFYNTGNNVENSPVKIKINDNIVFEKDLILKPYEKSLIPLSFKTPDISNAKMEIYINNLLWYSKEVNLLNQDTISVINVEISKLENSYKVINEINDSSKAIIINAKSINNEEILKRLLEIAKKKRIGIILDEKNKYVLSLIPSRFTVTDEKIENIKVNNIYYNEAWRILYKNKERGFVLNKNFVIFPGNPFLNDENLTFVKKLLRIQ